MQLHGWLLTFSLVVGNTWSSVNADLQRANSTKSTQKLPLSRDSLFINNITENYKFPQGWQSINNVSPLDTANRDSYADDTSALAAIPVNTSLFVNNYQENVVFLGPDVGQDVFISTSENLPQVWFTAEDASNYHDSNTVLENDSIEYQPVGDQIDRSLIGNVAEERQFRPSRRPPIPFRGAQGPKNSRRPFVRETTLFTPPPLRPNTPAPDPPKSVHPDISLIPLESPEDSGTNSALAERFPPFNDPIEPFPPFNEVLSDQPLTQLFTQEVPQPLSQQAPATLTQQSPPQPPQPQEENTQVPLQQITPPPQLQQPFLQEDPLPQPPLQFPPQEINQLEDHNISQQQLNQLPPTLPQQQNLPPVLQQQFQPPQQAPQKDFIPSLQDPHQNFQPQQDFQLPPPQKPLKDVQPPPPPPPQEPQQGFRSPPQQEPQPGFRPPPQQDFRPPRREPQQDFRLPQQEPQPGFRPPPQQDFRPPQQEPQQDFRPPQQQQQNPQQGFRPPPQQQQNPQQGFQPVNQPLSQPRPQMHHQRFRPSSLPPRPQRRPQRGSTERPFHFRPSRPKRVRHQRPRKPHPQRVPMHPTRANFRNTRQLEHLPRSVPTRIPTRNRERLPQGREQFSTGRRPSRGRSSTFPSVWAALQYIFEPSGGRPPTSRGRRFRLWGGFDEIARLR